MTVQSDNLCMFSFVDEKSDISDQAQKVILYLKNLKKFIIYWNLANVFQDTTVLSLQKLDAKIKRFKCDKEHTEKKI